MDIKWLKRCRRKLLSKKEIDDEKEHNYGKLWNYLNK